MSTEVIGPVLIAVLFLAIGFYIFALVALFVFGQIVNINPMKMIGPLNTVIGCMVLPLIVSAIGLYIVLTDYVAFLLVVVAGGGIFLIGILKNP